MLSQYLGLMVPISLAPTISSRPKVRQSKHTTEHSFPSEASRAVTFNSSSLLWFSKMQLECLERLDEQQERPRVIETAENGRVKNEINQTTLYWRTVFSAHLSSIFRYNLALAICAENKEDCSLLTNPVVPPIGSSTVSRSEQTLRSLFGLV